MIRPLILASSVLLGIGLVAPTMTIHPKAGDITWLLEIIDPQSMEIVTYSIVGIIFELVVMRDWFLVVVLSVFSVIFPVGKLCVFWFYSSIDQAEPKALLIFNLANILGKFSMAEVFILSLFIISLKTLPGGTHVQLEFGCGIYFLSVITSILVPIFIKKGSSVFVQ